MTSLEDKASESPEVSLARQSAPGVYRVEDTELLPADDLTPEGDFPEFGEFLEVTPAGSGVGWRDSTEWIECPQALAKWLVENGAEEGFAFRILTVQKVDGSWRYECEELSEDELDEIAE